MCTYNFSLLSIIIHSDFQYIPYLSYFDQKSHASFFFLSHKLSKKKKQKISHLIVEADRTEFRRTVPPSWNLWTRKIDPRKLKLNNAENASVCCFIRRIPLFSSMGTNFAVSTMPEYRPNKPNLALAIPLNLFYKNPGMMQNKNKEGD